MTEKALNALGLCRRANAAVCGCPMICKALQSKNEKIWLVVKANDVSKTTNKKLCDKCKSYEVRLEEMEVCGEALAKAVGKTGFLSAVAIKDENLAKLVLNCINEESDS